MELLEKITALEEEAFCFGLKWPSAEHIMQQIYSECDEIKEHLPSHDAHPNNSALQDEIGDLLHAVFSLCVYCKLSPQVTLRQTLTKFERRLRAVKLIAEEKSLTNIDALPFDEIMNIWGKAKELVG